MKDRIRQATYTKEFEKYYQGLPQKVREKYDYVFEIMFTKYVVSTKFVKHLEKTEFYEMRVSLGNNQYRTVLFAIDAKSFIECKRMVMLNSFVEKSSKQYHAEIKKAERVLKEWEDSL
ncbi:MAG: type II toxin-antitoxin system RelE/ParE family toxin [Prevotella sp.]|nr:type II toxin-antitoxin system RelE/ParE family toxin [Prevotella sp.]